MTSTPILPEAFADLAGMAAKWARPTENERNAIRWSASAEDFAAFHDAVMPRLELMLAELATCPLGDLDTPNANLFCLASAFAEAAPHHELYSGSAKVPHSFAAVRFVADHGDIPSDATQMRHTFR